MRHPFLHFPDDPHTYDLRYQFMLGPDFMIAPVLDRGADQVRVYLPAGEWTHLWTGAKFGGASGTWVVRCGCPARVRSTRTPGCPG